MLRELRLTNFRTFEEEITVRLRPITILIGKNSSGKSSIIKFLLMLQQSLDPSATHFLESEGDRVHLGAFPDLKNSKTKLRALRFRLTGETSDLPTAAEREMMQLLRDAKPRKDPTTRKVEFRAVLEPVEQRTAVRQETATYTISGQVGYGQNGQTGKHGAVLSIGDKQIVNRESRNLRPEAHTSFLQFRAPAVKPELALRDFFDDRYLAPVRYEIRSIKHLSAIREESQRVIIVSSRPRESVGQRGQYSMPHLQNLLDEDGDGAAFVMRHMKTVAGVGGLEFDSSMKGYLAHCKARNIETGAKAYLSDFGFGVSQCIPIFVQGAITPQNHLIMVEQPEAQLHPNAQLELGSFFAELWTQRKVQTLIETHSSNLLLRLRRLVARKELAPKDISVAYLHVEDGIAKIRNLDIDENGGLEKGLPMEFFGGDVVEGMKLGASK